MCNFVPVGAELENSMSTMSTAAATWPIIQFDCLQPVHQLGGPDPGDGLAYAVNNGWERTFGCPRCAYRSAQRGTCRSTLLDSQINYLMTLALEKVAYLPFAYLVDIWRWRVFSGQWGPHKLNARWWELQLQHQGLVPPVARSERDFDPGAKYHVAADMPYVRYFVSLVLQFQLYESLCLAAGHYRPLHLCDIYRSRKAGRLLQEVMRLGTAWPWQEAVQTLTLGHAAPPDPQPLLTFFRPLQDWLENQNRDEPVIGWSASDQDTALFTPLSSASICCSASPLLLLLLLSARLLLGRR